MIIGSIQTTTRLIKFHSRYTKNIIKKTTVFCLLAIKASSTNKFRTKDFLVLAKGARKLRL